MSTILTNGLKLPDKGSVDWYSDMQNNYAILDGAVGTIADHTAQIAGKAPVAHTHLTSDVTDLLSGNHTWTGNNTFSKQVCLTKVNDTSLKSQNSRAELGEINLSGDTYTQISFEDKNGDNFGYLRQTYGADGNNGFHFFVRNKFLNGTPDTTGTVDYSYFGLRLNPDKSKEAVFKANLRPYDSTYNYNLGDSTYQWNNLYAKNYYYNGVAWGLDKLNRWSQSQELRLAALDDYTLPSSEVATEIFTWWGTNKFRGGFGHQYYANGDEGCRFLLSSKDANNTDHLSAFRFKLNRAGTDSYFYGTGAQNFHLGQSTNKWKTFNGVNPGALSLPDNSGYTNISGNITDLTGSVNSYTPPLDGYVMVNVNPNSNNYAYVSLERVTVRGSSENTSGKNAMATIPVIGGKSIDISVIGASIAQARFTPCLGNV